MVRKKLLLGITCALTAGTALAPQVPAYAEVNVSIEIGVPPPPILVEPIPPPRVGFIWAPGYWLWNGNKHVWTKGRWVEARPGYVWVPERWEHRGNNRHHFHPGRWEPAGGAPGGGPPGQHGNPGKGHNK